MTTVLNLAEVLYAQSAQPLSLVRNQLITASGESGVFKNLEGVVDLAVKAMVSKSGAQGTLAVKLQHSDDGLSWSDLCTIGSLTSATPAFTVLSATAPKDYVKVVWTASGVTKRFSLSVSVVPVGVVGGTAS